MLVMLLGGPADGRVVEFNDSDVIVYPVVRSETYRAQRIVTSDRWTQVVFVHEGFDLDTVPESEMIRAIMTVWRERHRKQAESGLPHLPSGFTVTEEMLGRHA